MHIVSYDNCCVSFIPVGGICVPEKSVKLTGGKLTLFSTYICIFISAYDNCFVSFIPVGGTYKVDEIPAHMKQSFVLLSTEGVPPDASPEKPVKLAGGKLT